MSPQRQSRAPRVRRSAALASAVIVALFMIPAAPASASVVVDTTFSGNGYALRPLGFGSWEAVATIGNRVVVAGTNSSTKLEISEYNARGRFVRAFGRDGTRIITLEYPWDVDVHVDSTNRIVVFARSYVGFEIVRLTEAGALDSTFGGGDGRATFIVGDNGDAAYALDSLDRPVVVKGTNTKIRYWRRTVDGGPDTTFSDDGTFVDETRSGRYLGGVAVTSSEEIVVLHAGFVGSNGSLDLELSRLTSDGIATTDLETVTRKNLYPSAVQVVDSDSIMAVAAGPESGPRILAFRVNAAGDLDPGFAGDGVLSGPCDDSCGVADITLDETGATYLTGRTTRQKANGLPTSDAWVGRITPDGSWDESFASEGTHTLSLFTDDNEARSIALDAAGRILIAGATGEHKHDGLLARLLAQ